MVRSGSHILALSLGLCAAASSGASDLAPDATAALRHLVTQDCGSCHGLTLKGGLGSAITPDALTHYDRETLRDVILDGVPGTAMPPWRALLTEAEATWIANYLLTGGS